MDYERGRREPRGFQTLARMQARDEPVVVHFVGGESKPWLFMVLRFQNMADRIPEGVRRLAHALGPDVLARQDEPCLPWRGHAEEKRAGREILTQEEQE